MKIFLGPYGTEPYYYSSTNSMYAAFQSQLHLGWFALLSGFVSTHLTQQPLCFTAMHCSIAAHNGF